MKIFHLLYDKNYNLYYNDFIDILHSFGAAADEQSALFTR
jgi:hypothetical protein